MAKSDAHSRSALLLAARRCAAVAVAAALCLILFVQTPWGARTAGDMLVQGTSVTFGSISGNWLTTLEVRNLEAHFPGAALRLDTLRIRHRLLALLSGSYHIRSATAIGAEVIVEQAPEADSGAADPFPVRIDHYTIRDGRLAWRLQSDSTLRVNVAVASGSATSGSAPSARVDTLEALVMLPGEEAPLGLAGRASLADGRLTLDTLRVRGAGSDIALGGHMNIKGNTDLALVAAPLSLRDIHTLLPNPEISHTVNIQARLRGAGSLLRLTTDAQFSDGGRITLDAEVSPSKEGPLFIHVTRGSVRDLDLGLLTPSAPGQLSADLRGRLEGADLRSLSGALRLDMFETQWAGVSFDPTTVDVEVTDGAADITLATGLRGAQLRASGSIRLWDDVPAYTLDGQFSGLDAGRFVDSQSSSLSGSVHLVGHGSSARAELRLQPGGYNRLQIDEANITAILEGDAAALEAHARAGDGAISARGALTLGSLVEVGAEFTRLDVAALLGQATQSALTGALTVSAAPAWPPPTGAVRIDIAESFYDRYLAHEGHLQGALKDGRVVFSAGADMPMGALALHGDMRPFDVPPSYAIERADFGGIDLGVLIEGHAGDLNGSLQLTGQGFDVATMRLEFSASTLNDQVIDSARVDVELTEAMLHVEGRLATPEGHAALLAAGHSFDASPTFTVREGRFEGINLGAFLGLDYADTHLSGAIDTLSVVGLEPAALTLTAAVAFDSSRINDATLIAGVAQLDAVAGEYLARGALEFAAGGMRLDTLAGRFLDPQPTYRATGALRSLDIAALTGLPGLEGRITGRFDVAGEGGTPETMILQRLRLDASGSRFGDIDFPQMAASLRLRDGVLFVDTLRVRSSVGRLSGGGALALFGEPEAEQLLSMGGSLYAVSGAHAFSVDRDTARGDTLWALLRSAPDTLAFEAQAIASSLTLGDVHVLGLNAGVRGTLVEDAEGARKLTLERLRAELGRVSIPALAAQSADIDMTLLGDTLTYQAELIIDDGQDAQMRGFAVLPDRRVVVESLGMKLGDDRWRLDQKAEISFGDEYRVRNLLLVEDDQEIALDGVLDLDGRQSLGLTVYNLEIGAVADLFEYSGLGGTLNGDMLLSGPADSLVLDGSLELEVLSNGEQVGTLQAEAHTEDQRLGLQATLAHRDESTLVLGGTLPAALRLRHADAGAGPDDQLSLLVEADGFNVGWIEPFLLPEIVSEVEGRLTGSVNISGSIERPSLVGAASLEHGRLGLPALGVTLTQLSVDADLAGDSIHVRSMSATSQRGSIRGRGAVGLALGAYDLKATATDFRMIDTDSYVADVSGDVRLRGSTRAPVLTGAVRLTNSDIRPAEASAAIDYSPAKFTEEDVRMLERYFNIRVTERDTTTFVFYDALEMDLAVDIGDDVWLRSRQNPEMNVLLTGLLDLKKAPYQDQQLSGTVALVSSRSYVKQFGRRFDIRSGRVTFAGPATDPLLDLQAAYAIPAPESREDPITILMDMQGSLQGPDGLSLELRSEPVVLNPADIISYIATGRPAAEAFQLDGGGTLKTGGDLALQQLTSLIASAAAEELGLDVVEIQQDGSRGATLTAGKYISRRLYASVSWPLSFADGAASAGAESNKEVIIEYALFSWLLARLRGDESTMGMSLRYQYAY